VNVPAIFGHAGHWAADLLFVAPVLLIVGWVVIANLWNRRRQHRSARSQRSDNRR
jgi:cytochrome c-type biogenesis protein CcmH/NrfF